MGTISVNQLAMRTVQDILDNAAELGIKTNRLRDGSTIVDAGIKTPGGYESGRLIAEACMGGLGSVQLSTTTICDVDIVSVVVRTDHPLESCILSQLAGWSIKVGKYRAMGSGPARTLAQAEAVYDEYPYRDEHAEAVIILETPKKPTEEVSGFISEKCGIKPQDLYIILTPTSSMAGAVQICARIVETGMHKMHSMKVDLPQIAFGYGTCPIPPLSNSDLVMMGRTNDAMLYGGITLYVFKDGGSIIPRLESVPSSSSSDYGKPFEELFKTAGYDFYKLDPGLFSPAVVSINETTSGKFFTAGRTSPEVLKRSFGLP